MAKVNIAFLAHSGFAVETETKVLIFDYFKDPAEKVNAYASSGKPLWFFVTHWHEDHFNPRIADFAAHAAHYILNDGVTLEDVDGKKMQTMHVYDTIHMEDATITQYGSTDEGGSFLVETDGLSIFHAGDLNWWHWLGDTDENNDVAKENFDREMKKLDGLSVDIAFFPIDARLESAREWGVKGFLDHVHVNKLLVSMHHFGTAWSPSPAFKEKYGGIPVWIPDHKGEEITVP